MNWRFGLFVSTLLIGIGVLYSGPAYAQPAGSWSCNSVGGNVTIPQQLHSAGATKWKFKGIGFATNCDNSANTGHPVIAATYKFKGTHTGPNTCAGAGTPGYNDYLSVRWFYFNTTTFAVSWINRNYRGVPLAFLSNPCPGPSTTTLGIWPASATPGGPSATLSFTQDVPNCATTATLCASPYPGGLGGYSYVSPGFLSVP